MKQLIKGNLKDERFIISHYYIRYILSWPQRHGAFSSIPKLYAASISQVFTYKKLQENGGETFSFSTFTHSELPDYKMRHSWRVFLPQLIFFLNLLIDTHTQNIASLLSVYPVELTMEINHHTFFNWDKTILRLFSRISSFFWAIRIRKKGSLNCTEMCLN